MKKILFLIAFILGSQIAYAEDCSIDKVISWKYKGTVYAIETTDSGYSVLEWSGDYPKPTSEQLMADKQEYLQSQDYFRGKFNSKAFFGRLIQELPPERWIALSKLGVGWTMQQLIDYPNFDGLASYMLALSSEGTITESDVSIINGVLAEQGVVL